MRSVGHSRAFLIEMVFVLLFFSLSCVVIVQVFWAAYDNARLSREETGALMQAQATVEQWKAGQADASRAFRQEDGWLPAPSGTEYTAYYNEAWETASATDASYRLNVAVAREETPGGALCRVDAQMVRLEDGRLLCSIPAARYVPGEVAR